MKNVPKCLTGAAHGSQGAVSVVGVSLCCSGKRFSKRRRKLLRIKGDCFLQGSIKHGKKGSPPAIFIIWAVYNYSLMLRLLCASHKRAG